jgi:hypothetical protein
MSHVNNVNSQQFSMDYQTNSHLQDPTSSESSYEQCLIFYLLQLYTLSHFFLDSSHLCYQYITLI